MRDYHVYSNELVMHFYQTTVKANSEEEAISEANKNWDWNKVDEDFIEIDKQEAEVA